MPLLLPVDVCSLEPDKQKWGWSLRSCFPSSPLFTEAAVVGLVFSNPFLFQVPSGMK